MLTKRSSILIDVARRITRDLGKFDLGYQKAFRTRQGSIQKMLTNEKYKDDALFQKTYTVDFLSKKRADNTGQVPKYYVTDSDPAILDKEI